MTQSPLTTARTTGTGNRPDHLPAGPDAARTRRLLVCGTVAGPLFVTVVLVQALTRPGFDLARDAASLLDYGSWGWVQAANFIVTGLLFIAAAAALWRTMPAGPGSRWAPRLLTITGAGMIGGGVFHPGPANGFPPGTRPVPGPSPAGTGVLHEVCGSAAFLALIVFCFVLARRFGASGQRRAAACSLAAGVLCAAGEVTGGMQHGSLTLFTGVSIALLWTAFTAARLISQAARPSQHPATAPAGQ